MPRLRNVIFIACRSLEWKHLQKKIEMYRREEGGRKKKKKKKKKKRTLMAHQSFDYNIIGTIKDILTR